MKATEARNLTLAATRDDWEPSAYLTVKGAAAIWRDVVSSVTPDHFGACDEIVLASLCDTRARYLRVMAALERLPLSTVDENKLRLRRALTNEANALRAAELSLCRALRLAPVARRARDQSSTMLPPKSKRRKGKPGDDLFSC